MLRMILGITLLATGDLVLISRTNYIDSLLSGVALFGPMRCPPTKMPRMIPETTLPVVWVLVLIYRTNLTVPLGVANRFPGPKTSTPTQ